MIGSSSGDGDEPRSRGSARNLAENITSPGDERAVAAQGYAVIPSSRDSHEAGSGGRVGDLAKGIISPRDKRSVGAQCNVVSHSRGDGDEVVTGGRADLTRITLSPGDKRTSWCGQGGLIQHWAFRSWPGRELSIVAASQCEERQRNGEQNPELHSASGFGVCRSRIHTKSGTESRHAR